jgi:hypothetical protein
MEKCVAKKGIEGTGVFNSVKRNAVSKEVTPGP